MSQGQQNSPLSHARAARDGGREAEKQQGSRRSPPRQQLSGVRIVSISRPTRHIAAVHGGGQRKHAAGFQPKHPIPQATAKAPSGSSGGGGSRTCSSGGNRAGRGQRLGLGGLARGLGLFGHPIGVYGPPPAASQNGHGEVGAVSTSKKAASKAPAIKDMHGNVGEQMKEMRGGKGLQCDLCSQTKQFESEDALREHKAEWCRGVRRSLCVPREFAVPTTGIDNYGAELTEQQRTARRTKGVASRMHASRMHQEALKHSASLVGGNEDHQDRSQGMLGQHPRVVTPRLAPGDWACPKCKAHMFARRTHCFDCKEPRPAGMPRSTRSLSGTGSTAPNNRLNDPRRTPLKPGDWRCPNCNGVVFAGKMACFQCRTPRPQRSTSAAAAGRLIESCKPYVSPATKLHAKNTTADGGEGGGSRRPQPHQPQALQSGNQKMDPATIDDEHVGTYAEEAEDAPDAEKARLIAAVAKAKAHLTEMNRVHAEKAVLRKQKVDSAVLAVGDDVDAIRDALLAGMEASDEEGKEREREGKVDGEADGKDGDVEATGSECDICFDAEKTHVFIPCGHQCACEGCAMAVMAASARCPVCRVKAVQIMRVYRRTEVPHEQEGDSNNVGGSGGGEQVSMGGGQSTHDIRRTQEQFKTDMVDLGFSFYKCQGDGNSLFRAIAHQVHGDEEKHADVRWKCCDYILGNERAFSPMWGSIDALKAYVKCLRKAGSGSSGEWGDDFEIRACVRACEGANERMNKSMNDEWWTCCVDSLQPPFCLTIPRIT